MKKFLIVFACVLAIGAVVQANSKNNKETKEQLAVVEEFGCARDCVDSAFDQTINEAEASGELVTVDDYLANYEDCYLTNCAL